MDDKKEDNGNDSNLKIAVSVPFSWVKKFAREIIFLLSLFGWGTINQYSIGIHAHHAKQQFDDTQAKLVGVEQQLEKCRKDYEDQRLVNKRLERDLEGIKRELGIVPQ